MMLLRFLYLLAGRFADRCVHQFRWYMPAMAGITYIAEMLVPHWIYMVLYVLTMILFFFYLWGFVRFVEQIGGVRIMLQLLYSRIFKRKDDDDDDEDDRRGGKMIPVRGPA